MTTQTSPTTPVRVSKAVSTYTHTTEDPSLRSQINTMLLRDGHISKIQETLLHALNASPTNWPTVIQNHALAILRSGECTTFPALMAQVMEDIRENTAAARKAGDNGGKVNGKGEGGQSLALPKSVVDEGLRVTRECLEGVCEVVD